MIKLLIGGSPCTHWSIAQRKDRETTASGLGWELFKNYLLAKEKFKPDFFLYENNKSAARAIKDQISQELGVNLMYINSALVSAQSRERFYAFNWEIEQPKERGLVLQDILETPIAKTQNKKMSLICHNIPQKVTVRKYTCDIEKLKTVLREHKSLTNQQIAAALNKPITLVEHWFRKDKCFSVPDADIWFELKRLLQIKTTEFDDFVTVFETRAGIFEKSNRCYDTSGKMSAIMTSSNDKIIIPCTRNKQSYEVKNGKIKVKDREFETNLSDGFYFIRTPTVTECHRLQTLPDDYCKAVSKSQAYKGLGNGWTAEVIIHILQGALKNIDRNEKIIVLSMYDGIGTGRYCLDKMGFTNIEYYSYEIDKYAMAVANDNYPDIIQCGDAFGLREDNWSLSNLREANL